MNRLEQRIRMAGVRACRAMSLVGAMLVGVMFAWGYFASSMPFAQAQNSREEGSPWGLAGAELRTDADLESIARRADQYASFGRYALASEMWQNVLDSSGDIMLSRDGRIYRSVSLEVENVIRGLPSECLEAYRVVADSKVAALMAAHSEPNNEALLYDITQRFFLSSYGDDAAYELAGRAIDSYDFVEAGRLLLKVLNEYPDSSISRADIYIRLALINSRLGDGRSAQEYFVLYQEVAHREGAFVRESIATKVGSSINETSSSVVVAPSSDDWPVELGSISRQRYMLPLENFLASEHLEQRWAQEFSAVPFVSVRSQLQAAQVQWGDSPSLDGVANTDEAVQQRWRQDGGMPASQMLMYRDRVFYKTPHRLICAHVATGETAWEGRVNTFSVDTLSQTIVMYGGLQSRGDGRFNSLHRSLLLGDKINHGMAISGDSIYSLEGMLGDSPSNTSQPNRPSYGTHVDLVRNRKNWISSYHVESGKFQWRCPDASNRKEWARRSFAAAPTPYADLLIVPVVEQGALWLYGLNQEDRSVAWQSYLCQDPVIGSDANSPVGISIDGGEIYVASGVGIVFAVDARSGSVRWAVRYRRIGNSSNALQNVWGLRDGMLHAYNNWNSDMVIPFGRALIIMGSDSNQIVAIDRRTCEILWETPFDPLGTAARYPLGVSGRSLYVAGPTVVRRYDIFTEEGDPSGRLVWNIPLEDLGGSFGQGLLTDQAIYLPIKDSIALIDLESGEIVAQKSITGRNPTVEGEFEPVGNLYSNGEQLMAVGPGHVYAVTPTAEENNE